MSDPTRIIIRHDTINNWAAGNATVVKKGELAAKIDSTVIGPATFRTVDLFMGIDEEGGDIDSCPVIARGTLIQNAGVNETEITATTPVVYEDDVFKPDGTTVRWDATNSKWVADAKVLTLDAYPTTDGTVVYDADAGKFVVGTAVSATEIDGGTYT